MITFLGGLMAREYIIYTDESIKSGTYYGNFYGGALLRSSDFDSVNAHLRGVAFASGLTGEIKWQSDRPDGQPRRQLDTKRAFEKFGFQAQTSLEQGLRQTIDWYETTFMARGA